MEKIKNFFNSFKCNWYGFVIIIILIGIFINLSNSYYSNEYIDYVKRQNINFTIIHKVIENPTYKGSTKYLFVCKNNADNKICTIEVNPQTYVLKNVNSTVSFNISKEKINFDSETHIYKVPVNPIKSISIILLWAIITICIVTLLYPKNTLGCYVTFSILILFSLYSLFILIHNIFII